MCTCVFVYRIRQNFRGGKLSRFSRIFVQPRMFSSEYFVQYIEYKIKIIYILTNAIYSLTSPRILFQTNTRGTPAAIQYNDNYEDRFLLFS